MLRLIPGWALGLLLIPAACGGDPTDPDWAIELVVGESCSACSLFDEVREARDVGDFLEVDIEGLPGRVPVREVSPADLTERDFRDMAALPYMDEREARDLAAGESLMIVVRHQGRIRAAGNIAWSVNLPAARFPEAVMNPPFSGPYDELVENPGGYYRAFFSENWSLSHFLELALHPGRARPHDFAGAFRPSETAGELELETANVFIAGSAATPAGNPLFIPERIREIRNVLIDAAGVPASRIHIFFGDGGGDTNDTSVETGGELRFRPVNLGGERRLDGQALVDWFAALRRQETERNLIVQVGHGAPWGMPVWGHLAALSADELRAFHEKSGARNVFVSGACFGGIFAESASCGFFAARPDVVAAGCQRSPQAVADSDDYLRWYFQSLEPEFREGADADRDGRISFREAHWFAATRLEHDQIPFTKLDALADRYFRENPAALPVSMTPGALESLASGAPVAERKALDRLIERVPDGRAIDLTDPADQKRTAAGRLGGLADASSAERNEAMALPYRLALVQLARRLVFRDVALEARTDETDMVDECEALTMADYLN